MSTDNIKPEYTHEIKDAQLAEYSAVSRYKKFRTIYLKFKYQGIENWFMLTEHDDTPHRLQNIKRFGESYNIGDKFDFKFQVHSLPNKSSKLKIKSLLQK